MIALAATGASGPVTPEGPVTNSCYLQRTVSPVQDQFKEVWIAEVFDSGPLSYKGYTLEVRHRKGRNDYPGERGTGPPWIDVQYAVLKRRGKVLVTFDDNIYFGMGNSMSFGLFSFLGSTTKQLLVSQDVPRGGTQWLIDLSARPRMVFDGPKWNVGREGDDMRIIDLDGDNVYEITLPITDFYALQDKLPISQIPLPEIVFKYDTRASKYLPANPLFQNYLLRGPGEATVPSAADEFQPRSVVLRKTLDLIYVGKRDEAWKFYDSAYKLDDKKALRNRIANILNRQPVYKFIYNSRNHT